MSILSMFTQFTPLAPLGVALGIYSAYKGYKKEKQEHQQVTQQAAYNTQHAIEEGIRAQADLATQVGQRLDTLELDELQALRNRAVQRASVLAGLSVTGLEGQDYIEGILDTQKAYDTGIMEHNERLILQYMEAKKQDIIEAQRREIENIQAGLPRRDSQFNRILRLGSDFVGGYAQGDLWARSARGNINRGGG